MDTREGNPRAARAQVMPLRRRELLTEEVPLIINFGSPFQAFVGRTMLHPVHTHLAPFQILRRNGAAERVSRPYLLHCHNLEHEDHILMARVDVT